MGCIQNCHKSQQLIISLLFLLISSLTHDRFMAEGRAMSKLIEAQMRREESVVMAKNVIGSRPPRCERKCSSCGHCEAIQVPASTQVKSPKTRRRSRHFYGAYSRGDDVSNYKPMFWKCKCGDSIFNP